ncbi:capsular polysaccharide synthesis protein [Acinetobacter lanii]|uniref:Glycosyl transferase n=1 Tax=Acinetobacter lanii TaxID=2715163 RepID=A0A6G8S8B9_9GAMM|nr:capsular polysaccharide synthesis protein [Acinetobacter lanii]QIO10173.1 hypothetical protein G8D99_14945 [Acinetobacter lanii]
MNKIFAFWESNEKIPAYLELCKATWIKNIPNLEIHIINHSNLHEYIGDTYDLEKLKKISFPMQSDIISAAVLEKFGGLFMDLDCLITENIFSKFENLSEKKLIGFGYPNVGMHLAVLFSKEKGNPILREWRKTAQERLNNIPDKYDWSFFGNSILNPLLKSEKYKDYHLILDRTMSGNILESAAMLGATYANSKEFYQNFYFNKFFTMDSSEIHKLIKYGVVSLHNSWTPSEYKKIKDTTLFMQQKIPLVNLLDHILNMGERVDKDLTDSQLMENFFDSELFSCKNFFRKSYYKDKLIYDFSNEKNRIGFDIYQDNSLINLDLIIRDKDVESVIKALNLNSYNFVANKANVLRRADKLQVLKCIAEIQRNL